MRSRLPKVLTSEPTAQARQCGLWWAFVWACFALWNNPIFAKTVKEVQPMTEFTDLIAMKKSRKTPQKGDVFVVQPFQSVFYYGKVVKTNIHSPDSCVNGMFLIFIYDKMSAVPQIPCDLDNSSLLIAPTIVNRLGWSRGYFETICNLPLTEREENMPYGFWHFQKKCFVNAEGTVLHSRPKYHTDYGLGNYCVVGEKIQAALQKRLWR